MSPYDNVSRIPKQAFLVSTSILFAFCLISSGAHLYIRLGVQKSFAVDDGVKLFGIGCLIAAMALLHTFVDEMYLVQACESTVQCIEQSSNSMKVAFDSQKFITISLLLTWCSIVSGKFSYLFLFKRLTDRLPRMITYWYFVAVFNAAIAAYGATVYIAVCPHFYSLKILNCILGKGTRRTISLSVSQMVLDVIGDLLILFIPCQLIWRVRVGWTVKAVLSSFLCLLVLNIMCTIIRIAGLFTGPGVKIETIWETYWQFMAANLALTTTSFTSLCRFLRSRAQVQHRPSASSNNAWYTRGKRLFRLVFHLHRWRSKPHENSPTSEHADQSTSAWELRNQIPHGTMTGFRSFISAQGKTNAWPSQITHGIVEDDGENLPLHHLSAVGEGIRRTKQQTDDVTVASEDIC